MLVVVVVVVVGGWWGNLPCPQDGRSHGAGRGSAAGNWARKKNGWMAVAKYHLENIAGEHEGDVVTARGVRRKGGARVITGVIRVYMGLLHTRVCLAWWGYFAFSRHCYSRHHRHRRRRRPVLEQRLVVVVGTMLCRVMGIAA